MRPEIRALALADTDDKWAGTAGTLFAIAATLCVAGENVPYTAWGMRLSPSIRALCGGAEALRDKCRANGEDHETEEIAALYADGEITADELLHAGHVLNRYASLLHAAGVSY